MKQVDISLDERKNLWLKKDVASEKEYAPKIINDNFSVNISVVYISQNHALYDDYSYSNWLHNHAS